MTDAEYIVLCNLRSIPQRNDNFFLLYGEQADTAAALVERGWVVEQKCGRGERGFRLNKPGRNALLAEWMNRDCPMPALKGLA